MAKANPLEAYHQMRDFAQSPEPAGVAVVSGERLAFVIQKHAARSLHYDFRLELDGTLKSWAVPKGPSLDPADKRMAVHVEDHPLSYGSFEGVIPPKHYGAGTVIVWDQGSWSPIGDPHAGYREGKLKFDLRGIKLHGRWALVRMKQREGDRQEAWLLMKERDEFARPAADYKVVEAEPDSVLSGAKKYSAADACGVASAAKATNAEASASRPRKPAAPQATMVGAVDAELPHALAPQLATLVDGVPPGDDWLWEIKFDGYRLLTRVDSKGEVRCFTRNGHDWSHKLSALVKSVAASKLAPCWLDGEIVVPDAEGSPDFQALQNAFDSSQTDRIRYFVFDLPYHGGQDLRAVPLVQRRALLQKLLAPAQGAVRFSEAFERDPAALLESARQAGLEGLIGKRKGSSYRSDRSPDWVKLKTRMRQEFVIGGYTDPKGSRAGIGSLLLGVHDDAGKLRFAGNVGTGFDDRTLAALKARLVRIQSKRSPFADAPAKVGARGDMTPHWVAPTLIAEVSFAQWTNTGRIRHSVFHGLREDKPAREVSVERPSKVTAAKAPSRGEAAKGASAQTASARAAASATPPTLRLTHAERVIDTASGVTKGELVDFYATVAPLMLPHLKQRPVSLMRAPTGVAGTTFFQKHADATAIAGVDQLDPSYFPEHAALLAIGSAQGVLAAAQMNVIEFHTWNATTKNIHKPDRLIFDLDPGEGVAWPQVQEAASLMRAFLVELGLKSLLKTSGGKGLHVIVPIRPQHGWETLKDFSQAIVAHMAQVIPQRFVVKSGPKNRMGRIFIDYLRNGLGATTVCAWSARARAGLGVSVPVAWDELGSLTSGAHWTVRNIDARVPVGNTPWAGADAAGQSLGQAMKKLGFAPAKPSAR
ncbi:DNA ligase D [soil metagenome]